MQTGNGAGCTSSSSASGTGTADTPVIRPLSAEDVRTHWPAFQAIAADVPGEYWREEHFLLDLPGKWRLSCAAWQDGTPVGYAIVSRKAPGHAHLHHFMVAAPYRGSGLGTRMLAAIQQRCRAEGVARLTLKTRHANPQSRRFYLRHGFEECGEEGDHLVLGKTL